MLELTSVDRWRHYPRNTRKETAVRQKLKAFPNYALKIKFKEMRVNVKKMINISRANFFDSLEDNFLSNPKRLWLIFKLSSR
jgi:hypothetical protein